jgi:hypothetical protein
MHLQGVLSKAKHRNPKKIILNPSLVKALSTYSSTACGLKCQWKIKGCSLVTAVGCSVQVLQSDKIRARHVLFCIICVIAICQAWRVSTSAVFVGDTSVIRQIGRSDWLLAYQGVCGFDPPYMNMSVCNRINKIF